MRQKLHLNEVLENLGVIIYKLICKAQLFYVPHQEFPLPVGAHKNVFHTSKMKFKIYNLSSQFFVHPKFCAFLNSGLTDTPQEKSTNNSFFKGFLPGEKNFKIKIELKHLPSTMLQKLLRLNLISFQMEKKV